MYNEPLNHIPNIFCKCKAKVSMWSSKGLWEAQLFSTFATCFSGDSFTWEYRCIHWEEFKGRDNNPKMGTNKNVLKGAKCVHVFCLLREIIYIPTLGLSHIVLTNHVPFWLTPSCPRRPPAGTFHNLDAGVQRSYSVKLAVVPWKGLWLVHWGYRKKWIKGFRRMACVAQTPEQTVVPLVPFVCRPLLLLTVLTCFMMVLIEKDKLLTWAFFQSCCMCHASKTLQLLSRHASHHV